MAPFLTWLLKFSFLKLQPYVSIFSTLRVKGPASLYKQFPLDNTLPSLPSIVSVSWWKKKKKSLRVQPSVKPLNVYLLIDSLSGGMFFVIYVIIINFRSFPVLKYVEAEYDCIFSVDGFEWTLFQLWRVL